MYKNRTIQCTSWYKSRLPSSFKKPTSKARSCLSVDLQVIGLMSPPTRWITTLSSKVNLYHAINFRALCGEIQLNLGVLEASLVTPVALSTFGSLSTFVLFWFVIRSQDALSLRSDVKSPTRILPLVPRARELLP